MYIISGYKYIFIYKKLLLLIFGLRFKLLLFGFLVNCHKSLIINFSSPVK